MQKASDPFSYLGDPQRLPDIRDFIRRVRNCRCSFCAKQHPVVVQLLSSEEAIYVCQTCILSTLL